jgi:hypothetical protein
MSTYIVAIDPGIADLGVALYKDKKLVHVAHVKPVTHPCNNPKDTKMIEMSLGLTRTLQQIEEDNGPLSELTDKDTLHVCVEFAKAGSFMATFIRMAFVAGCVAGHYGDRAVYHCPQANQWKIGKQKEPSHEYYLGRLSKKEDKLLMEGVAGLKKVEKYDVFDATCIGLWLIEQQEDL